MNWELSAENIIDGLPEGVFVGSIDGQYSFNSLTFWNKKMEGITGYTVEEMNMPYFRDYIISKSTLDSKINEWIKRLNTGEHRVEERIEIIHKNCERKVVDITATIQHGDKDTKFITAVVKEISVRNKKLNGQKQYDLQKNEHRYSPCCDHVRDVLYQNFQNKLRRRTERYKWLVDSIPYAIYVEDGDKIVFCNKVGLEFLELESYRDIIGKRLEEILTPHQDFQEEYYKKLELLAQELDLPPYEAKLIRVSDNRIMDLEITVVNFPFYEEGNKLIIMKDISERKRSQDLQRAIDEKNRFLRQTEDLERLRSEFFANVSHELRTPVNVIFSSLQLLRLKITQPEDPQESSKLLKYIDIMKQNCYRLIRLINNLIDVTKIDSGYFNIDFKNYNIVKIIEDITLSIVEYVEEKGITLIFDTDLEEKVMACDADSIERIILNLISNAVKFTGINGIITVTITEEKDNLVINVRDNGIGIPAEKQKVIFDRFAQADKSLVQAKEGSGIGLSLVKSLVEMHKGSISVNSEHGRGSEFIVELPVKELTGSKETSYAKSCNMQGNIEKINIEFSDIYF
jgi:PAS domain S-box-containing protein